MAQIKRKEQSWPSTKPVPASKAKAHFLELVSTVGESGDEFVITKRGKPVAKLIPFRETKRTESAYGCMAGTFEITGDIMSPEPDIWDAMR